MILKQTGRCAVIGCKLKQNANEGCNSCASLAGLVLSFIVCFIACSILLEIGPLLYVNSVRLTAQHSGTASVGRMPKNASSSLNSATHSSRGKCSRPDR